MQHEEKMHQIFIADFYNPYNIIIAQRFLKLKQENCSNAFLMDKKVINLQSTIKIAKVVCNYTFIFRVTVVFQIFDAMEV